MDRVREAAGCTAPPEENGRASKETSSREDGGGRAAVDGEMVVGVASRKRKSTIATTSDANTNNVQQQQQQHNLQSITINESGGERGRSSGESSNAAAPMSAVRRGNAIATAADDDDDSTSATTENKGSQQSTAKRRMLFKTAILPHAERKELHAEIYKYFQWLQHNLIEVQQQTSNNNKYTPLTKAGIIAPAIQQVLQGLESAFKGIEEDAPILARVTKSNIQQEKVPFLESVLKDELSQLVKGNSVDSFEEMVDLLRQYKQQKGDVNVPKSYKSDFGSPLGQFVKNIRQRRKDIRSIHGLEFELQITSKYSLTKDRIQALDGMGFQWSTMESSSKQTFSWEERIQQLKEWRHTHGNLQIPRQEAQYGLGEFVSKCRRLYNKKDVTFMNTRAPTLESIGFEWKGINHSAEVKGGESTVAIQDYCGKCLEGTSASTPWCFVSSGSSSSPRANNAQSYAKVGCSSSSSSSDGSCEAHGDEAGYRR